MDPPCLEDIPGFDDVFDFNEGFVEKLSLATKSHDRNGYILDLLNFHINFELRWVYDYYIDRLLPKLDDGVEPSIFFDKEHFQAAFQHQLSVAYDKVKKQINFGGLFLTDKNQALWLEELGRELTRTFESYKKQEKVDVLFESYQQRLQTAAGPDPSTAPSQVSENGRLVDIGEVGCKYDERDESGKSDRFWNHETISRDETWGNNPRKELLCAINCPRINSQMDQANNCFPPVTAGVAPARHQQSQLMVQEVPESHPYKVHKQENLSNQHSRGMLDTQKVRLQQDLQTMLSDIIPTQTPDSQMPITAGSFMNMNMAHSDLSAETLSEQENNDPILQGPDHLDQTARENDFRDSCKDHQDLVQRIILLEQENKRLKKNQAIAPRCQVLYFIVIESAAEGSPKGMKGKPLTMAYLDEPAYSIGPAGEIRLRANSPISDVPGFLRQRPEIVFIVSYYYALQSQNNEIQMAARTQRELPRPKPFSENLRLVSPELIEAVDCFLVQQPKFSKEFPSLDIRGPLHAPYLFWYRYRSSTALDVLRQPHRDIMQLLTVWIEEHYAKKFDRVDDQLKRGVVSEDTMPFLVKPGTVLVWKDKEINAVVAGSWPYKKSMTVGQAMSDKTENWKLGEGISEKRTTTWTVDSWRFKYDGKFYRNELKTQIVLRSVHASDEVSIKGLNICPLEYADGHFKAVLKNRGVTFWTCRYRRLVSSPKLHCNGQRNEGNNGERFMVDFETYRQIHSSSFTFKFSYPSICDDKLPRMDPRIMKSDEPPPAPDIYVFPKTIPGYNLQSKKWVDLKVDMIRDVTWNKKSFEHLVVDEETKELVKALVQHQIARNKSTDIIDRKGNGLIMLLHGGPGTGKTFTAESVAEIAEKPLFRITCSDIGTEPVTAEKYLTSILYLGKTWDCIVLIDEAEVFLEQRNLNNLERNALVSVFLRVLEYYEGILILTSNRVGTFDEAFKSRILLSLHYENLIEGQRTKIWKNFFKRLKEIDEEDDNHDLSSSLCSVAEHGSRKRKFQSGIEGIDFDDIECYITELAKHELNGRQIRNVITTARQLAVSRNQAMGYKHLDHVIKVSSKFDKYLKTVREGFSDDQVARDEGIRQ
ncbi:hypothetical protein E8E14_007964 [Neopestalotiopsis sp. 37M]|nr:hypothetical protein E8E14_007964 [Neopestalotiopsis sp. 37M]